MKILFCFFILLFAPSVLADDITDFEIEGISIGDSLLDYISEEKIKTEIKENKYMYNHLSDEFAEVYLYDKFKNYEKMSFFVKTDDEKFIIHAIFGDISFIQNINDCYKKRNEIVDELSKIFINAIKEEVELIYPNDPSGKSKSYGIYFEFDSGDIKVECTDFEENFRKKNDWAEGLSVAIGNIEFIKWITNY